MMTGGEPQILHGINRGTLPKILTYLCTNVKMYSLIASMLQIEG